MFPKHLISPARSSILKSVSSTFPAYPPPSSLPLLCTYRRIIHASPRKYKVSRCGSTAERRAAHYIEGILLVSEDQTAIGRREEYRTMPYRASNIIPPDRRIMADERDILNESTGGARIARSHARPDNFPENYARRSGKNCADVRSL